MKINDFRGELTDISANKEALATALPNVAILNAKSNSCDIMATPAISQFSSFGFLACFDGCCPAHQTVPTSDACTDNVLPYSEPGGRGVSVTDSDVSPCNSATKCRNSE